MYTPIWAHNFAAMSFDKCRSPVFRKGKWLVFMLIFVNILRICSPEATDRGILRLHTNYISIITIKIENILSNFWLSKYDLPDDYFIGSLNYSKEQCIEESRKNKSGDRNRT